VADQLIYRVDYESQAKPENTEALSQVDQARAVAEYLGDMIGQLESMARVAGFDLLVYLLSMARAEAELNARDRNRSGASTY
jgi:hypothetical protein